LCLHGTKHAEDAYLYGMHLAICHTWPAVQSSWEGYDVRPYFWKTEDQQKLYGSWSDLCIVREEQQVTKLLLDAMMQRGRATTGCEGQLRGA
jgi:hypothetical protein